MPRLSHGIFCGLCLWWSALAGCTAQRYPPPARPDTLAPQARVVELLNLCPSLTAEATADYQKALDGEFGPDPKILVIVGYRDEVYGETYLCGGNGGRAEVGWVLAAMGKARPGWKIVLRVYWLPVTA